jgi:hypothetical protein
MKFIPSALLTSTVLLIILNEFCDIYFHTQRYNKDVKKMGWQNADSNLKVPKL